MLWGWVLWACSGDGGGAPTTGDTGGGPAVQLFGSSRTQTEDFVGRGSASVLPDGEVDIAYGARVVGPVSALYFLITGPSGEVILVNGYYRQADTDAGTAVTDFMGTTWRGVDTWVLGVDDGAGLINAADGTISLGEGVHDLTLWIAPPQDYDWSHDPAVLTVVRPDGTIERSAVYDPP
jgi:hypothetical protein